MAVRKVLVYPDPRLREVAKPVVHFDESLRQLVNDMFETMDAEEGCGLAATQIGVGLRVLVIDTCKKDANNNRFCFINPEITLTEGTILHDEGCLSFPSIYIPVNRAVRVQAKAYNVDGELFTIDDDDRLAHILQHELDHLNGKVFIDYVSPLKREWVLLKLKKLKKKMAL